MAKPVERKDPGSSNAARDALHSFAKRMHSLCDDADEVNESKKELRAEIKSFGLNVKAVNAAVRRQRADRAARELQEAEEALYWEILEP